MFLGLGMLAGEDGPGGLDFDNFQVAYTLGALALAVVLFDGGLRTHRSTLALASWPAFLLATVGVLLTAGLTGAMAVLLFPLTWLEGMLVGSIVASTDAAAVFFLLGAGGTNLVKRVRATLETESGINDPMAVFLTVTCVALLDLGQPDLSLRGLPDLFGDFLIQIAGGALLGIVGGLAMVRLINALNLATGLYPILALSGALVVFGIGQSVGASGFLAVYLAGVVLGNRRHRATLIIDRFLDGLAWLSQIGMFLMLGLLVTPTNLLPSVLPSLGLAAFLILVARPVAVLLCTAPFGFNWRERSFLGWVGLRGAVPIFLGTVPVLAGLPNAEVFFEIAFVIVLTSLVLQGWTVNLAARQLNLALPPAPGPAQRFDVDLPAEAERDLSAFVVQETSASVGWLPPDLRLEEDVEIVAVIRDGVMRLPSQAPRLAAGDYVVVVAPGERMGALDRLFGSAPRKDPSGRDEAVFGEFTFGGETRTGDLARMYDLPIPPPEQTLTLDDFMRRHLRGDIEEGDRLRLGEVELIVRALDGEAIAQVGIELEPRRFPLLQADVVRIWLRHWLQVVRSRLIGRRD